jgi:hypothetical protein
LNEKLTGDLFHQLKQSADENAQYIESHPYDDFSHMQKNLPISGEPREIEWDYSPDLIVIGDEELPLFCKISDLSDKFNLNDYEVGKNFKLFGGNSESEDYYQDKYMLSYMERDVGVIDAYRKKDESPDNAIVNSLLLVDTDIIPFPVSIMGIPVDAERTEIEKSFPFHDDKKQLCYSGLITDNGKEYFCFIYIASYDSQKSFALICTPLEIDPTAHESYLKRQ